MTPRCVDEGASSLIKSLLHEDTCTDGHDAAGRSLAPPADASMNDRNKERNARLDALEKRCVTLENRAQELERELRSKALPTYCGTYQDGADYFVGNLVTRAGGLWLCAESTSSTPGTDHGAWRLIVKSGRA